MQKTQLLYLVPGISRQPGCEGLNRLPFSHDNSRAVVANVDAQNKSEF